MDAVSVLARQAAKRAVKEELRAQGARVTLIRPAEITERARAYLDQHPEVYREALEQALHLGLISPLALLRNLDNPIYWGELEQAIYELVRSKYHPVT